MNGGAGRVIASIPAFEKLLEKDEDFIIVCEGGTDFYKGHPTLHERAYDNWHKNLFRDYVKDLMPDVELMFDYEGPDGKVVEEVPIPIGVTFFWPES